MWSIFNKEISAFFSSLIGYVVIAVFLILLGLVLFVFPDTSLLTLGVATLDPLFANAPRVFMFLIPAITMRSLAEEQQTGTFELLVTKPISEWSIILGKFWACLTLVVIALIPTLLYYYTMHQLGVPKGNLDSGAIAGSYLGLIFLAMTYVSIGLFASALTNNQIIGFLLGAFLCFLFHWGFDLFSRLPIFAANGDTLVQQLGIDYHYRSISRGVLDLRDVVYFLSVSGLFLYLTFVALEAKRK